MQNNGNLLHYVWKYLHLQQIFGFLCTAVYLWLVLDKHRAGRPDGRLPGEEAAALIHDAEPGSWAVDSAAAARDVTGFLARFSLVCSHSPFSEVV